MASEATKLAGAKVEPVETPKPVHLGVSDVCTTSRVHGTNINWMVTLGKSIQEDLVVEDVNLLVAMGDDRLRRALAVIEVVRGKKR